MQLSHDVTAEVTKIINHPLRNLGTIKSNYEEWFERHPFEHSRANECPLAGVITLRLASWLVCVEDLTSQEQNCQLALSKIWFTSFN